VFIVDIPGHHGEEMRERMRITTRERTRRYISVSNVTTTASHHVIVSKPKLAYSQSAKTFIYCNYSSIYTLHILQVSANLEV
jgi:hypothetical protein